LLPAPRCLLLNSVQDSGFIYLESWQHVSKFHSVPTSELRETLGASRCLFSDSIPGSRRLFHFISGILHFSIANCCCRVSTSSSETKLCALDCNAALTPSACAFNCYSDSSARCTVTALLSRLPARLTAIRTLCARECSPISKAALGIDLESGIYVHPPRSGPQFPVQPVLAASQPSPESTSSFPPVFKYSRPIQYIPGSISVWVWVLDESWYHTISHSF
jgi:hypothetical protein